MPSRGHETIDHTADMGIRGWGSTPAEAFEEAAAAMFELMADVRGLAASRRSTISRAGADLTELLVEFLNGMLSDADLAGTVYLRAAVTRLEQVSNGTWALDAAIEGVPLDDARDRLRIEVKAATYCGASVLESNPGVWVAQCVVDL
jgi:SHS2 domain-containing protein